METVLIVIHLMVVIALVVVVLLQRSEGGALGMGGGGGGSSFMSARGAANALSRTTSILAIAFFATSIALGIYARVGGSSADILDRVQNDASGSGKSVLEQITPESERKPENDEPAVPSDQ